MGSWAVAGRPRFLVLRFLRADFFILRVYLGLLAAGHNPRRVVAVLCACPMRVRQRTKQQSKPMRIPWGNFMDVRRRTLMQMRSRHA